jgi:hypothetical protein
VAAPAPIVSIPAVRAPASVRRRSAPVREASTPPLQCFNASDRQTSKCASAAGRLARGRIIAVGRQSAGQGHHTCRQSAGPRQGHHTCRQSAGPPHMQAVGRATTHAGSRQAGSRPIIVANESDRMLWHGESRQSRFGTVSNLRDAKCMTISPHCLA